MFQMAFRTLWCDFTKRRLALLCDALLVFLAVFPWKEIPNLGFIWLPIQFSVNRFLPLQEKMYFLALNEKERKQMLIYRTVIVETLMLFLLFTVWGIQELFFEKGYTGLIMISLYLMVYESLAAIQFYQYAEDVSKKVKVLAWTTDIVFSIALVCGWSYFKIFEIWAERGTTVYGWLLLLTLVCDAVFLSIKWLFISKMRCKEYTFVNAGAFRRELRPKEEELC